MPSETRQEGELNVYIQVKAKVNKDRGRKLYYRRKRRESDGRHVNRHGYAPVYPTKTTCVAFSEASRKGISYSWFLCGGALAHDTRSGGVCGSGTFGSPM